MREEHTIHLLEIPIGGKDGFVWNRLHAEREDICEALAKEETESSRKILQTRLRKVDDALDRLMSGSYGHCSKCGGAIDDARLEIEPTVEYCYPCQNRQPGATAIGITSVTTSVQVTHKNEAEARGELRCLALMMI